MLKNYWYIACASSRLDKAPRAVQVLDRTLVIFRDRAGSPHALVDRCCHRGVRLSLGTVIDGCVSCRYHGWRFDGSGRCVHIPALTRGRRIPEGSEVPSFPCVEQHGYVWVWMGDKAPVPAAPPAIAQFDSQRWQQGSVVMQCDALKGIENTLDWAHPYFTHPFTHGQFFAVWLRGFTDQHYELRVTEHGLTAFSPTAASAEAPIPKPVLIQTTFELPDRVVLVRDKPLPYRLVMHFVPTGEQTCRLEWMSSLAFPIGRRLIWTEREPRILQQDRIVLESAQEAQQWPHAACTERSVEADAAPLLARRIVGLAGRGQWAQERARLPQRKIVAVRA